MSTTTSQPNYSGRIAVLVTCFNRREQTLLSLKRLFEFPEADLLDVFLLDDGSSDGTGSAVRENFPQVRVFDGDGSYFWSGGMRYLFAKALELGYGTYLWINDDTEFDQDALTRLLAWQEKTERKAILGGSMREPDGEISYGGNQRHSFHPTKFSRVLPDATEPKSVSVLNGNFLLIPGPVAKVVRNISEGLLQQGADFEYSTRTGRAGFGVLLLPGSYGVCSSNDWGEPTKGIAGLRKVLKPRHLPLKPTIAYYKVMCGAAWPFWLAFFYLRVFLRGY